MTSDPAFGHGGDLAANLWPRPHDPRQERCMKSSAPGITSMIAVAALASFVALPVPAQTTRDNDLLGTWTWTMPKTGCVITRTFRPDGTILVVNGKKTTEGTYSIRTSKSSDAPFVVYSVTRDGGGRSCDDESDSTVGKRYLAYFNFNFPKTEMTMCLSSDRATCLLGPYRRK